jgi:hypothetical protein
MVIKELLIVKKADVDKSVWKNFTTFLHLPKKERTSKDRSVSFAPARISKEGSHLCDPDSRGSWAWYFIP